MRGGVEEQRGREGEDWLGVNLIKKKHEYNNKVYF